jgi:hypothetical protein
MTRLHIYCVLLIVPCVGCGGADATVQGTVTIDGQLAPRGAVMFHPIDDGPTAYGTISENGTYVLRIGQGDRSDLDASQIHSGDYIVTAVVGTPPIRDEKLAEGEPPQPGPRLTAAKYANKDTSDLRVTVKPGTNVVPLELEGAHADETEVEEAETEEPDADDKEAEEAQAERPGANVPAGDVTKDPQESADEAADSAPEPATEPVTEPDPSTEGVPQTES